MLLVEGNVKKLLVVTSLRGDEEGTVSFSVDTGSVGNIADTSKCLGSLCRHS